MRCVSPRLLEAALAGLLLLTPESGFAQHPKKEKTPAPKGVWNYDGGVFFETDGHIPNGACFRLAGRLTAPGFFDDFKRLDGENGAEFHRGPESVTHFPDQLALSFRISDFSCSTQLHNAGLQVYLTREQMNSLRLALYWKRGVALRPIENFTRTHSSVESVAPYAPALAAQLSQRFRWSYEYSVPSAGVPLTDSLVIVVRTQDGRIAARVAARL
jgi:hypothetical protein